MKSENTLFHFGHACVAVLFFAAVTLGAESEFGAFSASRVGVGNESSGTNWIGIDFRVVKPVVVSQLGMFDSGGDGVRGSGRITVQLCESSPEDKGSSVLESATFDHADSGKLAGGFRYKALARPITLLPGHYTLAASGFDAQNLEYNSARSKGVGAPAVAVNNGGGLIGFLGWRYRNSALASVRGNGSAEQFAAATFLFSAAPTTVSPFAADYAALTAGVTSFPVETANSNVYSGRVALNRYTSLTVLEDNGFPLIVEPSGNRLILAAAGTYQGNPNAARCVVFAHEQFGQTFGDGRMVLFENAIKWASRKANPSEITIALSTNMPAAYFISRGYQVRMADRGMKTNDFNPMPGVDVLVVDFAGPYTERFMTRAAEFVANGGGVVATATRFLHTESRPIFGRVNRFLAPFGLAYRSSLVAPVDPGFATIQQGPYAPVLFNAFPAARLLRKEREGQVQLSSLEKSIALNTIAYAADRQVEMLEALTQAYSGSSNGGMEGAPEVPSQGFADVLVLAGAQADTNWLGAWSVKNRDVVAMSGRGSVEYNFELKTADVYRVQIFGTQNLPDSVQTNFDLIVSVDEIALGQYQLQAGYGGSGRAECYTPYLLRGSHKLKIFWDNPRSDTQLRLQGVHLQSAPGEDRDGNGIKDWVEKWVGSQSGLDATNPTLASYVSPLCLEGRDAYVDLIKAEVSGADFSAPKVEAHESGDKRWYVNVPLASSGNTGFRVSYQNGARTEVRRLRWLPVNVLGGGSFTVRKNDKLALIARPAQAPAGGEMQFTIGTNQFVQRNAGISSPLAYEFDQAGTFNVQGAYVSAGGLTQTGTISVTVVEQRFNESPDAWVGSGRQWDVWLPGEAVLQADSRLLFEAIAPLAGSGWRTGLLIDQNESRQVLARLGANGPILDSTPVRGFDFWSGEQTYLRVMRTYPDESQLVEMLLVLSPVLPDVAVRVELIVGGVLFEDGTTTKELGSTDFDALGKCTVRFIRPASAKTSVCHSIKLYQGLQLIGYIR